MRFVVLLPVLLSATIADAQPSQHTDRVRAKLEAVTKTQEMVRVKIDARESEMRERMRALYKLSRSSFPKLWLKSGARQDTARWLGAARRIASRDISELALLRDELALANAAEHYLEAQREQEVPKAPRKDSLLRPIAHSKIVGAFGDYKLNKRLRLHRRGVQWSARKGRTVQAVAKGTIRYVGPISGLGTGLVVDHGDFWVILGHLQEPAAEVGDQVERGTAIAEADGSVIYLELRLAVGQAGHAIDPTPMFK